MGTEAYLIDTASEIKSDWFKGKSSVGVTAGASAPEILVQEVISQLEQVGGERVTEMNGVKENTVFSMPRELKEKVLN
jgi:4-hydroxy-3-methylbut-2-enyl diphosphate reductase